MTDPDGRNCAHGKTMALFPVSHIKVNCSVILPETWSWESVISFWAKLPFDPFSNELILLTIRFLFSLQIKREPCQVSEVTTSNNYEASTTTALTAVVKLEAPSPKAAPCSSNSGTAMDHIGITSTQNNAAATIPVGIAVARQRLQESTNACGPQLHHQAKELNRFGIAATGSTADLGNFR